MHRRVISRRIAMEESGTTGETLSNRALNRTLLARQGLLERRAAPPLEVIASLVGMQAQEPRDPYVGLWSRIDKFEPADLEALLLDRSVVRIVMIRGTVHLVTADDCIAMRCLFQPVLDYELTIHSEHKAALASFDMQPLLRPIGKFLAEAPRTPAAIRTFLRERFPDAPSAAAAYAARNLLPLVQVPPRGLWSSSGQVKLTTADAWLGRAVEPAPAIDDAVLRYLAAFGPSTPADFTAWSRLKGAREILERMQPDLRVFRDERGRELFDVENGLFADPDVPAPVRFLPEYDNVVLSHRDRSRVVPDGLQPLALDRVGLAGVLVDGYFAGFWYSAVDADRAAALLHVELARRITKKEIAQVEAEGRRLARFRHPEAESVDVQVST